MSSFESDLELRADAATRDILDVADGLDRIMGDRPLYMRMLVRFRADYQSGLAPVRKALTLSDAELAHRLVHTLKGATGMLGAHRAHRCSSLLEHALRTFSPNQEEELNRMEASLQQLLSTIDGMHQHLPGAAQAGPSAPELLDDTKLLSKLMELLATGDGAAIDIIEQSSASLRVILGEGEYADISAACLEFDFERALSRLQRFA